MQRVCNVTILFLCNVTLPVPVLLHPIIRRVGLELAAFPVVRHKGAIDTIDQFGLDELGDHLSRLGFRHAQQ